jgi:hydroxyacyl-ACP dehydratase HTD2-like protein with hotdog domain
MREDYFIDSYYATLVNKMFQGFGIEKVRHYEVTAQEIRRFNQAIGAKECLTLNGNTLVAPPLFYQVFMFDDVPPSELALDGSPQELDLPIPAKKTVGGSSNFEIYHLAQCGDHITVRSKLKEVVTKQGKNDLLYLVVIETTFTKQDGKLAARETATYVKRS